ncbi:MAG: histone deacetylase [Candidatus Brocadiaceae bacterium]|nr:histone deacetylase [Candidatus Brocadiaceae bacterium]
MNAKTPARARFVYSPLYRCDIGTHVFPIEKYALLHDRLVRSGQVAEDDFLAPAAATRAELELVHTPEYLDDLFAGRHTERTVRSEMRISHDIVAAFALGAGGTVLACRTAVRERTFAMNLAGGFHHAFADWAEGFCYINDVALGVHILRADGLVRRAMVVDCDLHQGNGTAELFRSEPEVFTFSIHEEAIYPIKRCSDLDIGLPSGCSGAHYLRDLERHLPPALDRHRPEFVLYVAGADPYRQDQLGSLQLSMDDLKRRDELVIGACAERGIPAAVVLAGGYAARVDDTVTIHYNTALTLLEHSRKAPARPDA